MRARVGYFLFDSTLQIPPSLSRHAVTSISNPLAPANAVFRTPPPRAISPSQTFWLMGGGASADPASGATVAST